MSENKQKNYLKVGSDPDYVEIKPCKSFLIKVNLR